MEMPISSDLKCFHVHSSSKRDTHNVAIILNNTGVTLLQKSCYLLAAESFRDAIHVMKLVVATDNNQDVDINVELSNKMENVSKRLIECRQKQISNMNCSNFSHNLSILSYDGTIASISNAAINTDVFEYDEIDTHLESNTDEDLLDDNLRAEHNGTQFISGERFAILIIDHHLRCPSYDIDAAIIMYNYGIAIHYFFYCPKFLMQTHQQEIKDVMNNSNKILLVSYDILHRLSSINDENDSGNEDEHLIIILLACLVTMALFHNAMDSDTPDESFHFFRVIRQLRYKYEILNCTRAVMVHHLLKFVGGPYAAAA